MTRRLEKVATIEGEYLLIINIKVHPHSPLHSHSKGNFKELRKWFQSKVRKTNKRPSQTSCKSTVEQKNTKESKPSTYVTLTTRKWLEELIYNQVISMHLLFFNRTGQGEGV